MTQRKTTPAENFNDPDKQNSEQEDASSQAQSVAQEALRQPFRRDNDSTHGGHADPTQVLPDDAQDLVDHMNDMERSGRIDMDAFAGEEKMDDEDGSLPD